MSVTLRWNRLTDEQQDELINLYEKRNLKEVIRIMIIGKVSPDPICPSCITMVLEWLEKAIQNGDIERSQIEKSE